MGREEGVPSWRGVPAGYTPLHPQLFTGTVDAVLRWLDPRLLAALSRTERDAGSLAWCLAHDASPTAARDALRRALLTAHRARSEQAKVDRLAQQLDALRAAEAERSDAERGDGVEDGAVLKLQARLEKARARLEPCAAALARVPHAAELASLLTFHKSPGVVTFPCFTAEACDAWMEEVARMEETPSVVLERPNTMNNYGAIVNGLGFGTSMNALIEAVVCPLAGALFPAHGGLEFGGTHHRCAPQFACACVLRRSRASRGSRSFLVKYKMSEDLSLNKHRDASDVTLNVCLGRTFTGGTLFFHGEGERLFAATATGERLPSAERTLSLQHVRGMGVMHIGDHIHGADPLTSGERWNLIVWRRRRVASTGQGAGAR